MTHLGRNTAPRFFLTAEASCPYLPGRRERKIFTHLFDDEAPAINAMLTTAGFRRSQTIAYKPACDGCSACVSVRIPVAQFEETASLRRIRRVNADLEPSMCAPVANADQYDLLRRYLDARHAGGGMNGMDEDDYAAMVEETTVDTQLVEYREKLATADDATPTRSRLLAAAITDVIDDGLSMVYSFFDPNEHRRSLGTFMILDHVDRARALGMSHVYLGYWIDGCRKMAYKARFRPLEALTSQGWLPLGRDG